MAGSSPVEQGAVREACIFREIAIMKPYAERELTMAKKPSGTKMLGFQSTSLIQKGALSAQPSQAQAALVSSAIAENWIDKGTADKIRAEVKRNAKPLKIAETENIFTVFGL